LSGIGKGRADFLAELGLVVLDGQEVCLRRIALDAQTIQEQAYTVSRGRHLKLRYNPPLGSFQSLALDDGVDNEPLRCGGILDCRSSRARRIKTATRCGWLSLNSWCQPGLLEPRRYGFIPD
jgi:hypothetical protein